MGQEQTFQLSLNLVRLLSIKELDSRFRRNDGFFPALPPAYLALALNSCSAGAIVSMVHNVALGQEISQQSSSKEFFNSLSHVWTFRDRALKLSITISICCSKAHHLWVSLWASGQCSEN